ncbi:MAG: TraU family protein [Rickettsiaceae bacterium]|nr:TraU family protein [Rickettsiaceae bacterium]
MKALKYVFSLIIYLYSINNFAVNCTGNFVNPITDVCWSCLFPLTIGSAKVVSSKNPDTENPASPICACGTPVPRIGLAIGFWEPTALVDVTRKPFCFVNMGGLKLNMGAEYKMGMVAKDQGIGNSFYDVHWYKFPLMYWLNLLTQGSCMQAGDFDLLMISELDPTWSDSELAFILNTEAILFGNPLAQAACAADAVASSTGLLPLSPLFWCSGAQGSNYPLSGSTQNHIGGVQASTLLTQRMAFKLHRELLIWDSVGVDGAICEQYPMPIMPKHRYRYQAVNPVASTSKLGGCKPFGYSTALWEAGHELPVKGEDFGYLVWKKRNCCAW